MPGAVASAASTLPTAAARDLVLGAVGGGRGPAADPPGLALAVIAGALLVFAGVATRRRVSPRRLKA